jgi:hypothetical protein
MYYRIPVVTKEIELRKNGRSFGFVQVGGIGYKVICHKGENLEQLIDEINKKPTLIKISNFFVEANGPEEAVKFFYKNYPGANGSSINLILKACHVDKTRAIIEIPDCGLVNQNSFGEIICGEEVSLIPTKSGKFGFCVMQGKVDASNCKLLDHILTIDKNRKFYNKQSFFVDDQEYVFMKFPKISL